MMMGEHMDNHLIDKLDQTYFQMVGNTPLVKLNTASTLLNNTSCYAKLEMYNPGGSVLDRLIKSAFQKLLSETPLEQFDNIVCSLNHFGGIEVAMAAAALKKRCIITSSSIIPIEVQRIIEALGGELISYDLTDSENAFLELHELTKKLADEIPRSIFLDEVVLNLDRVEIMKNTLLEELKDFLMRKNNLLYMIVPVTSGDILKATIEFFEEHDIKGNVLGIKIHSAPDDMYYKTHIEKTTLLEKTLNEIKNTSVRWDLAHVNFNAAYFGAKRLALNEGILGGIYSGAAYYVIDVLHGMNPEEKHPVNVKNHDNVEEIADLKNTRLLFILADSHVMYLSSIYSKEWATEKGIEPTRRVNAIQQLLSEKPLSRPYLIYLISTDTVDFALRLMSLYDVSNLPVFDKNKNLIGSLSESLLLKVIAKDKTNLYKPVSQFMSDPWPVISINAPIDKAIDLLYNNDAILVKDKIGNFIGILTKRDILKILKS